MSPQRNVVRITTPRSIVPAQSRPSGSLAPLLVPATVALAGVVWGMLRRRKNAVQPAASVVEAPRPVAPVQAVEVRMTVVALVRRFQP